MYNKFEFDNSDIKYSKSDLIKKTKIPKEMTLDLAYETGLSIGDGCIPKRKYSYRLKGNKNDEKEFYSNIVKPLYKKVYNLEVKLKEYDSAYGFEIYSMAIKEFKVKKLGLSEGSKKEIKVPYSIKNGSSIIKCSFIKGYFDTDGSIAFLSKYNRKNYYPTITAVTISEILAQDIFELLNELGFTPNLWKFTKTNSRKPNTQFSIRLNGYKNFRLYRNIIGTKQKKNIDKINKWEAKYKALV